MDSSSSCCVFNVEEEVVVIRNGWTPKKKRVSVLFMVMVVVVVVLIIIYYYSIGCCPLLHFYFRNQILIMDIMNLLVLLDIVLSFIFGTYPDANYGCSIISDVVLMGRLDEYGLYGI